MEPESLQEELDVIGGDGKVVGRFLREETLETNVTNVDSMTSFHHVIANSSNTSSLATVTYGVVVCCQVASVKAGAFMGR